MGCASSQDVTSSFASHERVSPISNDNYHIGQHGNHTSSPRRKPDKVGMEVNRQNVLAYLEVDQKVRDAENKNIRMKLLTKKKQRSDLEKTLQELIAYHNTCLSKTAKEKADVDQLKQPSVLDFFKDQSTYDAAMSKEQEEYLEALTEQEVAQKEMEGVKVQHRELCNEITNLEQQAKLLQELHDKQDKMLEGFFGGNYGSDRENILESELDLLLERQQRVMISKDKWQNGRLLIYHACDQLAIANSRWAEMPRISLGNLQRRYYTTTEARNNFIAASQNISNAGRLLEPIRFPYCTPDEVHTLNRAVAHIYIDMQTPDRHAHAAQCYYVTHKRTAALYQWFDFVIDNKILVDLDKVRFDAKVKQRELRNERIRLLKDKYKEKTGETINIPEVPEQDDYYEEDDVKINTAVVMAETVHGAEQLPQGNENETLAPPETSAARIPTPVPKGELAQLPSEEEIFGNMQELQARHMREIKELEKVQEANRTRQQQGLQEKLRARRSRRDRQKAQEMAT